VQHGKLDALVREAILGARVQIAVLSAVGVAGGLWVLHACRAGDLPTSLTRAAAVQLPIYLLVSGLVLPAFNTIRTYAPQGQWIREHVAPNETAFALFNPDLGHLKRSAFQYYAWPLKVVWAREGTGPADDSQKRSLQTVADVDRFFEQHPGSICLVDAQFVGLFVASDREAWQARTVQADFFAGGYHYTVFGARRR
jgi:hypothetical protein